MYCELYVFDGVGKPKLSGIFCWEFRSYGSRKFLQRYSYGPANRDLYKNGDRENVANWRPIQI